MSIAPTRSAVAPAFIAWIALVAIDARGQDQLYAPSVARASAEPDQARLSIRHKPDLAISLFAAEPRLANPVAFTIDDKGRFFVVETFRLKAGVTDNRAHMYWLDDDLASRTVADREKMTRKWLGKDADTYAVEHDRIKLIEDRDHDGKADFDTVFADGFKDLATGIGAGVLVRKGDVYFACIPDLWLLRDTKGTGKADVRKSLSTGYGVHVAFLGHDLHGLIMGPDGRLYFSIGDRGLNVVNREGKTLAEPDTGSVLRCWPDGSGLEIFATGLRNPQELAFNNFGDLFTVDNNSDSGDKARVVHIVEGGDSGWRIGYQYIEEPVRRGPWNAEKLWYPSPENTATYLLPPLMNLSDGPSGLTFDPGVTLLPDRFRDHFLLADFRGGHAQSGVRSFAVEPVGASYKVVDPGELAWSVLATDLDFGPDGALYVSDWVDGWDKTGKGRIWRIADPKKEGSSAVKEVQTLLGEGMTARSVADLLKLLGHADRRIRLAAQFELADRSNRGIAPDPAASLFEVARSGPNLLARLHAIWGIGQLTRNRDMYMFDVQRLVKDEDAEIRAQSIRLLGELTHASKDARLDVFERHLTDPSPRVQFFAARSLGRLGNKAAVAALLKWIETNADRDAYLRHAGVLSLAELGDVGALAGTVTHPSPAVRLAAVLALRRLDAPEIAAFLNDTDRRIVLEAARGIYDDRPKNGPAMTALASLAGRSGLPEAAMHRVLNANARVGGKDRARSLVAIAMDAGQPESIRVEALELLGVWGKPSGRDRVTGLWRPYEARPLSEAAEAIRARLAEILNLGPNPVRLAAVEAIGNLGISDAVPSLIAMIGATIDPATQVEALKAIEKTADPRIGDAVLKAIDSTSPTVRREGQRLLAKASPERAIPILERVLNTGSVAERQGALAVLATMKRTESDSLILAHLKTNDLPGEVELDLLDAAEARRDLAPIGQALEARARLVSKNDPIGGYRAVLLGGDAKKGRAIFEKNTAVYCLRCHKVKGEGGEVGPDLTGIGAKKTREYLAESIVHPNQQIAQGFETVVVALNDGKVISGVFRSEDDKTLRLMTIDNKPLEIPKHEIDERKRGPSAMPDDIVKKLKKSDLRDLVEFLATLR